MDYKGKPVKELKIVFSRSKKLFPIFSWAIMLWTQKPYSHVARAIQIRDWGFRFSHATEGSVRHDFEVEFYRKNQVIKEYRLAICEESDLKIKRAFYEEMGKVYGMLQNVGIFLVDIGLVKDTPWKKGRNCSELVYRKFLKEVLPHLNYNPDTIKPHHIEDIILAYFEQKEDGLWHLTESK